MGWPLKGKFKLFQEQKGFSLFEVLVAVGILGLIGAGLLTALNTNYRAARTLDEQVVAVNLATAHFEAIREVPYAATYPSAGDNITIPSEYNVGIDTKCSSDGTNFSPCVGSDNETFQKIILTVSREGKPVLLVCTYRAKR